MKNTPNHVLITGLNRIMKICHHMQLPKKVILTGQIIFHSVYQKLETESENNIPYACVFLAAKIEESYINLEVFLTFTYKIGKIKIKKENFIQIERKIAEALDCNFSASHIHVYVAKICNTLKIDVSDKFKICDDLYLREDICRIGILKKSECNPFYIALSLFSDEQITKIERNFGIKFDIARLQAIKTRFFES